MILVDVTEQAKNRRTSRVADLQRYLTPPSLVVAEKLEFGDVAFNGHGGNGKPRLVGVEIKSVPDCIQCIDTGRFAGHQLPGLHDTYDEIWLLVEGELKATDDGVLQVRRYKPDEKRWGWVDARYGQARAQTYAAWVQWLTSMEVAGGVRIARTASRDESARWIAAMYWWWQKPWQQHKSLRVVSEPQHGMFARLNDVAKMAAQLPGVGYERALAAGQHFKSPLEMINADVKEWQKVEGVGKKIAMQVCEAIRRERGGR